MNHTEENIREQMRTALATYTGPITKCPAGKPRGKSGKFAKWNRPNRWLNLHRNDVAEKNTNRWLNLHRNDVAEKDTKAESRRIRMARAQRERTAIRNAAIKRRIGAGAP
jgi:hypothetical protein